MQLRKDFPPGSPSLWATAKRGVDDLAYNIAGGSWTASDVVDDEAEGALRPVKRVKANCRRASRAARASDPSNAASMRAYAAMTARYSEIQEA